MVCLILYVVLISVGNTCGEHSLGIPFMLVQQKKLETSKCC